VTETPTDMAFLDLVNLRLDQVRVQNSKGHYEHYVYMARRWIRRWSALKCSEISPLMIEQFVVERSKLSPSTANREIRYLRATFNYAKKRKLIPQNPTDGIDFLPVEKRVRTVPSQGDIDAVIAIADPETADYLWVIRDTMGRMSEINRLAWEDVNFEERYLVLYTRKKKGGHLTPREVTMTQKLFAILSRRYEARDPDKPWVFWHRYTDPKTGGWQEGPYRDRKKFMRTLCKKAGVAYFRFHALRHAGASAMDQCHVPIGTIQRILGHENRTTTEIYLHGSSDADRQAMMTYEKMRGNSHTESHTDLRRA
jgi:integrase